MHLRGKDSTVELIHADSRTETLLSVPRYDFNWQFYYTFKNPPKVEAGARLKVLNHFDNSPANRNNPDPSKEVTWGDQTWEEMSIMLVELMYDLPADVPELEREAGRGFPPSTADELKRR
jgi:hypothetical protein